MKQINFLILLFSLSLSAQDTIEASFLIKTEIKADSIIGLDTFKTMFYTIDNVLVKQSEKKQLKYSNTQLNTITSSNTFNPLKINIFYKDFNTVVILDNRLAEIYKIDFNQSESYKNVTHISTGNDNLIWIFNQDLQQLELYNYKTRKTSSKTIPIVGNIINITSNYNYCWLLTNEFIYKYNYTGSLISKIKNDGYTVAKESNGNIFLKKANQLFFLAKNSEKINSILIPNLLISQFLVTNEILYIYTGGYLHQYQLKLK